MTNSDAKASMHRRNRRTEHRKGGNQPSGEPEHRPPQQVSGRLKMKLAVPHPFARFLGERVGPHELHWRAFTRSETEGMQAVLSGDERRSKGLMEPWVRFQAAPGEFYNNKSLRWP